MIISAGITLAESGKIISCPPLINEKKITLKEYAKINDPIAKSLKNNSNQKEGINGGSSGLMNNFDPYKDFKIFIQ